MIAFYTSGSASLGFGHVSRTVSLCKGLQDKNIPFICWVNSNKSAQNFFADHSVPAQVFNSEDDILNSDIKVLVFDTKDDLIPLLKAARKKGIKLIAIDSLNDNRFYADMVIYPNPHFNPNTLDWFENPPKIIRGARYTILGRRYVAVDRSQLKPNRKRIVVSMGGADPNELTLIALKALLNSRYTDIDIVIGPGFSSTMIDQIKKLKDYRFTIHENQSSLLPILSEAGCLITALGISIYEAAYLKVPSIVLSNFKSDFQDEKVLDAIEGIFPVGYFQKVTEDDIKDSLHAIYNRADTHSSFCNAVAALIDGKGVERVLDLIIKENLG